MSVDIRLCEMWINDGYPNKGRCKLRATLKVFEDVVERDCKPLRSSMDIDDRVANNLGRAHVGLRRALLNKTTFRVKSSRNSPYGALYFVNVQQIEILRTNFLIGLLDCLCVDIPAYQYQ